MITSHFAEVFTHYRYLWMISQDVAWLIRLFGRGCHSLGILQIKHYKARLRFINRFSLLMIWKPKRRVGV